METIQSHKFEDAAKKDGDKVNGISISALDASWEMPKLEFPYKLYEPHPMAIKFGQESHDWLASHGVEKQLGPDMWKRFLKHNTPDLYTHMSQNHAEKEYLLGCKFMVCFFALDSVLDDSDTGEDIEKSMDVVLEILPVFMWKYPEEPALRNCLRPLYNLVFSKTSKKLIEVFEGRLDQAKRNEECNYHMSPVASAWRDIWADCLSYGMPDECNVRLAESLLEYLVACAGEAHYRSSRTIPGVKDYTTLRRGSIGMKPCIVFMDIVIHVSYTSEYRLPNSLFYTLAMHRLLLAMADMVAWHNDVFSFYKECIVNKDTHNIVYIISHEQKCSYTEAAETFVKRMLKERIDDMDSAITDLSLAASADLQPAVQIYAEQCRNWISGTHEWHSKSTRYKCVPLS